MNWDFSVVSKNLPAFASALGVTVWITLASILLGTALGTVLGILSLVPLWWLRWLAKVVIGTLLALPVLVIIIWIYYCLPLLQSRWVISGEAAAILGLGTSLAGFVAEIVRAGINSVPLGQIEAAYCTGLTRIQAIVHIMLPQALRRMSPALCGQYITCYKMSTLAAVVAVEELLHTGSTIISQTYRPLEIYTAIAAIFAITLWPINHLASKLERTVRFGGTEAV